MKKCKVCGSYAINHQSHGRDGSELELCDVCYWRKKYDEEVKHRLKKSPELEGYTQRKIFICVHCEGIYADLPVSQCDCMNGSGKDFIEGLAECVLKNRRGKD